MNHASHDRNLSPYLLRMLEVLERVSSSLPLWRSVAIILVVGFLSTILATWWAWSALMARDQYEQLLLSKLLAAKLVLDPHLVLAAPWQPLAGWFGVYAGVVATAGGCVMLTFATLYAHMLIISTRMRAHQIAQETTQAIMQANLVQRRW